MISAVLGQRFRKNLTNLKKVKFGSETPILSFLVLINLSFLPISQSSVGWFSKTRQEYLIAGSQVYRKGEKSDKSLVENSNNRLWRKLKFPITVIIGAKWTQTHSQRNYFTILCGIFVEDIHWLCMAIPRSFQSLSSGFMSVSWMPVEPLSGQYIQGNNSLRGGGTPQFLSCSFERIPMTIGICRESGRDRFS